MKLPIIALIILIHTAQGFANDAFSGLSTGGIEFKKSNSISMENEELSVSLHQIMVKYDFLNTAKNDEKVIISFPFPEVDAYNQIASDVGHLDFDELTPILDSFELKVDGKKLSFQKELKAFKDGNDVTNELKSYDLDLTNVGKNGKTLEQLSAKDFDKLLHENLIERLEDAPSRPKWKIRMSFFWEQIFPAGKHVHIQHKYAPSRGSSYLCLTSTGPFKEKPKLIPILGSKKIDHEVPPAADTEKTEAKFCVDKTTRAGIDKIITERRKKSPDGTVDHFCDTLQYILTSANTWYGPIKNFHLTLEKPKDNIVSTCFPGIKKTGVTKFESRLKDFTPKEELEVLFISPKGQL